MSDPHFEVEGLATIVRVMWMTLQSVGGTSPNWVCLGKPLLISAHVRVPLLVVEWCQSVTSYHKSDTCSNYNILKSDTVNFVLAI